MNYTVTSAFAIDCGAFTFTATENSEIGTAATLPDIRFISPTSATPTLTLNTGDGASMLNFSADALGSINLSISRNSHLLSDAIANPTLVVTASVPSSATCTVNPTTTTLSYSGNPQTATADFSIDWTGEEGRGGTCPVTIKVQEQDRELVTLATTIIFTAVGRVDLAINPSTFPNDTFPNAFFARERVNVTATATKRDTLTDPDTGVIFRKPVLVFEQIENYCVVISPTSDTPRNFTPNVIGDNETLDYVFGVNPDLGGRFNGRCEWRITTSSQGISGNNNSVIINPSFAISDYPPLLNVSEIATNVYPDDGAVPLNLTVTKRDNLPLITSGISTAITTSVGPCSVTRVQEVVYPSIDWGSIGTASYNVMFVGDATNGGTCVLNKFTATEDDHLTTTVTEERSITFLAEAPPAAAFNIEGSSSAPASSFTTLNITLTKQDASTNKELTIPSVVGSSACTATLIGDAPARFTGGIGSSIELSYNITSTHIRPVDGCGNFPFPFTEGSAAGTTDFDGDSISFTPPLGNVAPTIQVSVIGEGQVMDSEPVTINVTATKQDFEGERVTFPQTVMSSAPVCTANLATGFTAEVNYGGSDADLTASVQYTVMPNTPINCGDFNFNATEDALVVRAVPLAGILFFNQASTAPLVEFQGGSDFNVTAGVRSTRVNLIITRRSHLSSTPLENPTVSIFVDTSSPSCSRLGSSFGREYGVTPSSTISTGAINYELDVSLINDVDMRDGGTCLVNVLVREPGQLEVASMLRIRFLPVAAQVDFNTDYTGNEGNPFFAVANKNIIVTATATKGDAIAEDGRRGVIFHSILVNSTPAGACVLTTSPAVSITTTGGNSSIIDFPATARGSQRVLAYEFGVATGFRAQRVECEWALSATAEHSPDTSATPTSVYLQFTVPGNDPPTFTITEGNVTRFPDEGPVQYTLNITRQDEIGDGQLVVTPTTADACRIISPAQPPAYQNRMATATYGVVYTGAANGEGDLPGGTCVVNFVVAEDGATAPVQQSSVTFNTELAPSITVQVIGNRVDLPADQTVNVSVTATKRDSSPTPDVTFPREVISSSRCSATLVGNEIKQYNDILGGSSSATVTYIIATGPDGGDCSNFAFTATEGTATATNNFASDISFVEPDADGDGVSDAVDVDKDGDGLIELSTATQLDAIRYNLAGTGLRLVSRLRPNNANGCPATGGCRGYELVADIDLSAYANWNNLGLSSTRFTATFEGNNHTISNLNFDEGNFVTIGQGLFAYIHNAVISNVHLRNVSISSIGSNVGGLVGSASGTSTIINSSVTGPLLRSTNFQTGGLVGVATSGVQIISSYVEIEEISSAENTGGLLGRGNAVVIRDSYAIIDKIKSVSRTRANHVGGLVGYADGVNISFSLAIVNEMMTSSTNRDNSYAGGLVGYGLSSNIASSAAITGSFIPPTQYHQFYAAAGGLTAWGYRASIESSYAVTKNIFTVNAPPDTGPGPLGPLVGTLRNIITPPTVSASYWDKTTRTPPSTVNFDATNHGQGKSTTDLQGTTDFSGIYSAWGNSWCDATTNEFATDPSHPLATIPNADANRFWDLGTATEYPAMNCLPNFTPAEQRATMAKALNGESPLRN
ncbi:MAG: hypothetical protein K0U41_04925 [Gammaproteobacteria bacterium]|nr:hypothetical protein [Gammaproteobacteria bacterium]